MNSSSTWDFALTTQSLLWILCLALSLSAPSLFFHPPSFYSGKRQPNTIGTVHIDSHRWCRVHIHHHQVGLKGGVGGSILGVYKLPLSRTCLKFSLSHVFLALLSLHPRVSPLTVWNKINSNNNCINLPKSFINWFTEKKNLLTTYSVPDTALYALYSSVERTDKDVCSHGTYIPEKVHNKQ